MSFKEMIDKKEEEREEEKEKKKEKDKEKEREKDETDEKIRTLFKKIRTFDQLKTEVFEIKKSYDKTCEEINEYKEKTNLVYNKYNKFVKNRGPVTTFEQIEEEKNYKNHIYDKLIEIDKKFKIIFGDTYLNDEEIEKDNEKEKSNQKNVKDYSKDNSNENKNTTNNKQDHQKKGKILNLTEINRRLGQLNASKISSFDFEAKNDAFTKKLAEIESKINDVNTNLFGASNITNTNNTNTNTNTNTNHIITNANELKLKNKFTYLAKKEFDIYKIKSEEKINKIFGEINNLKKLLEDIINQLKEKTNITDLENLRILILKKMEELFINQNQKYTNKFSSFEIVKEQFKKLLELLAIKEEEEKENWLIAKKPMNGYSCASCESFLGTLKNDKNKFIHWNKMPSRERDLTGEKFYRIGNGYSRLLQMINFDNNGNVTLNPFPNSNNNSSTNNNSINMSGNDNNKSGELNKSSSYERFNERISSAKNKNGSREKNRSKENDFLKSRNEGNKTSRKLPAIKWSMSSDNFDKLIDNKNVSVINKNISIGGNNTSYNFQNTKVTKVLKKTK